MPASSTLTFLGKDLKSFVRRLKGFVSTDDGRPIITGVHLFERDGGLTAEATDSYKLIRFNVDQVAPAKGFDVIVPFKFLENAAKGFGANEQAHLEFSESHLTVRSIDGSTTTNLIDGDYPNVSNILDGASSGIVAGAFSPEKLKDMASALLEWSKDSAAMKITQMDGMKPLIVELTGQHFGAAALMPIRVP